MLRFRTIFHNDSVRMRNESLSRRVFSMALVLALAVLAAVLLAQSPLGVVLGSGLFDSPLATPTPARYVGAPLAVGTTPRFEIVQEGGVWHSGRERGPLGATWCRRPTTIPVSTSARCLPTSSRSTPMPSPVRRGAPLRSPRRAGARPARYSMSDTRRIS